MSDSFMQVVLPCDDAYLRAAATQRPPKRTLDHQLLGGEVERYIARLLQR